MKHKLRFLSLILVNQRAEFSIPDIQSKYRLELHEATKVYDLAMSEREEIQKLKEAS